MLASLKTKNIQEDRVTEAPEASCGGQGSSSSVPAVRSGHMASPRGVVVLSSVERTTVPTSVVVETLKWDTAGQVPPGLASRSRGCRDCSVLGEVRPSLSVLWEALTYTTDFVSCVSSSSL